MATMIGRVELLFPAIDRYVHLPSCPSHLVTTPRPGRHRLRCYPALKITRLRVCTVRHDKVSPIAIESVLPFLLSLEAMEGGVPACGVYPILLYCLRDSQQHTLIRADPSPLRAWHLRHCRTNLGKSLMASPAAGWYWSLVASATSSSSSWSASVQVPLYQWGGAPACFSLCAFRRQTDPLRRGSHSSWA